MTGGAGKGKQNAWKENKGKHMEKCRLKKSKNEARFKREKNKN